MAATRNELRLCLSPKYKTRNTHHAAYVGSTRAGNLVLCTSGAGGVGGAGVCIFDLRQISHFRLEADILAHIVHPSRAGLIG